MALLLAHPEHVTETCEPAAGILQFRPRKTTTRIIIHGGHEDVPDANPAPLLRVRGREMGLLEIGYHTVIDTEGALYRCCAVDRMGAHTPGNNHDSIGIYLSGRTLPEPQVSAVRREIQRIFVLYRRLPVLGKSEVIRYRNKPTGPFFDMDELRAKLWINP